MTFRLPSPTLVPNLSHLLCFLWFLRSKGSTLAKRPSKKGEDPWNVETPLGTEELDRTRKILQWMMEGEKEAGRYKKSPYG